MRPPFPSLVSAIGLVLTIKWTAVLALAWLGYWALAQRNPRWRVVLWRFAVVALVLVTVLSAAPPIVTYRLAETGSAAVEMRPIETRPAFVERTSIPSAIANRTAPKILSMPDPTDVIHSTPFRTESAATVDRDDLPPAGAQESSSEARIGAWCWSTWVFGVLVLLARFIAGTLSLSRIIGRSTEVPEAIERECRAIAERLACRRAVRLRRSSELETPCLAGLWHPVLVLSERECRDGAGDDLRGILAHELAHARNRDLFWNRMGQVTSILLWFHPLAWRVRTAHAAACDAVCDALAADLLGDVTSYSRTLARLALRAALPSPAHGLAMARTSDVRRRLDALNRKLFRASLSWRFVMPALFAASVLLAFIGGFGFTYAEPPRPTLSDGAATPPTTLQASGKLKLHAVKAATSQPIEGVSIEYGCLIEGKYVKRTITTDKDGTATIDYPPASTTGYFAITARMPKLVPIYRLWDDKRHPLEIPATAELRFEAGTTIGGIIQDEGGQAIEGAAVRVYAPPTEYEGTSQVFTVAETKSDGQGRWHLDVAPPNLAGVALNVEHARYRTAGGIAARNLDSMIILTKGPTVTGRVVDAAGRPIKGARAVIGHDTFGPGHPFGTTNEQGEFTLENCDLGPSIITVRAEGFAPKIQDVRVGKQTPPVRFQLTEPGAILLGRVVDIKGKPVAGAFFGADTWRGHRSLDFGGTTDKDGRFEWKNAPHDVVLFDAGKSGYMSSRQIPLTASGREHVITVYPELVVSGQVTDVLTGRQLPKFRLIRGQKYKVRAETDWAENEAVEITGGRYTTRFSEPCDAFFVRVEAPGYEPADSRAFRSIEMSQTFDFALRRSANQLSGVVLLPDGKPAARAEVVLDTRSLGFLMEAGRFDRRANVPKVTTGPDGRFSFEPPADPFVLIAFSDAGYVQAFSDEFARSDTLVLQPWGKIEGEVRIGRQPAANQEVDFNPGLIQRDGRIYGVTYGYRTVTDARGRFAFERVVPGRGAVSRVVTDVAASQGFPAWGWQEAIEVKPNQTTRVQVGGKGRPVIGRVVIDGQPDPPVDWTRNQPIVVQTPREEVKDSLGWHQFSAHIDKVGRFHIEDVPPGKYVLELMVNSDSYPKVRGPEAEIGWLKMTVTVPQPPVGRPDEPVDLGTVTAELFETIKVGDRAPDFTVARIAGKGRGDQLKLSDYQGKLVLLDFWATWCGPCRAEMPAIKDIQTTFGSDARFQLIGMSCDETPDVAQQYIKENGLIWTHGFAGNLIAGVSAGQVYKVRAIPATFLIRPDGRVLAKNLRGAELKEAIRMALSDVNAARKTPPDASR